MEFHDFEGRLGPRWSAGTVHRNILGERQTEQILEDAGTTPVLRALESALTWYRGGRVTRNVWNIDVGDANDRCEP